MRFRNVLKPGKSQFIARSLQYRFDGIARDVLLEIEHRSASSHHSKHLFFRGVRINEVYQLLEISILQDALNDFRYFLIAVGANVAEIEIGVNYIHSVIKDRKQKKQF